jgi:tRNA (cmo5U34)-methyltransferase
MRHAHLVKEHFDFKYKDYDVLIRKLIPRYSELHRKVISLTLSAIKKTSTPRVLDLGIGTGQTALALLEKKPDARIDGIDISAKMIREGKTRLKRYRHVSFQKADMAALRPKHRYDVCIAVLSVHHLSPRGKSKLFKKIFLALKPGGRIVLGDLINFPTPSETRRYEQLWKEHLYHVLGKGEGEFWFQNYLEEDRPSPLSQQLKWLQQAGFRKVSTEWQHLNYAVFYGEK